MGGILYQFVVPQGVALDRFIVFVFGLSEGDDIRFWLCVEEGL